MTRETESISVESVEEFFARAKIQGIAAGLRVAAEIVREYPLCNAIAERIMSKANEIEKAAKLETEESKPTA